MCKRRTFEMLNSEQHPFLVNYFGAFQTSRHVCLKMEYVVRGDLKMDPDADAFPRAVFTAVCVVVGLEHLHSHKIAHRDLKLDNLLLDKEGFVKIAHFGICKEVTLQKQYDRTGTFIGTADFIAPEALTEENYTRAVDWWALGVLLYEMLVGKCPFTGNDENAMFESIIRDAVQFPSHLSREATFIITGWYMAHTTVLGLCPMEAAPPYPFFSSLLFQSMDWPALLAKKVTPPFIPTISKHEVLCSSAGTVFTLPHKCRAITEEEQELFKDFEFVADWI
ncbi:PKN2 kinase, partial [Amia calva]|nr:PKN2 kinase [Amia calva]